jgi:hypothetical protein
VSEEHLPQVDLCVLVVEDSTPTEDKEIQSLDLRGDLLPGQRPDRDGAFDVVPGQGVGGIP